MLPKLEQMIAERVATPVYIVFFLSSSLVHWKFWVALFAVSEEGLQKVYPNLLKTDYLAMQFYWDTQTVPLWLGIIYHISPFILTWFFIWWFPRLIGIPAYNREQLDKARMQTLKSKAQKSESEAEQKVLKLKDENISLQQKILKKEKSAEELKRESWDAEFEIFSQLDEFKKFDDIIAAIYEHNGNTHIEMYQGRDFKVDTDVLAYSHSIELIEFDNSGTRIQLTEKGRYFVKLYREPKG